MARISVDIDDHACAVVIQRYGLRTKAEAVNFALREIAEAASLRGSGWLGDLDELRAGRIDS